MKNNNINIKVKSETTAKLRIGYENYETLTKLWKLWRDYGLA